MIIAMIAAYRISLSEVVSATGKYFQVYSLKRRTLESNLAGAECSVANRGNKGYKL